MAKRNTVTKATTSTIAHRTGTEIGTDIIAALVGVSQAQDTASKYYREAAEYMDTLAANWTAVEFNKCKSPESQRAAFAACSIDPATEGHIMAFRKELFDTIKAARPNDTGQCSQKIKRWSAGYEGSAPNHPEAKAKAEKAKANAATKDKVAGESIPATTELPVAALVAADPQQARMVISHVIEGLNQNVGLRKKNKVNVTHLQDALQALQDACEAIAADKAK